ncbi:MAG: hypothetical protein NXI20_25785 [bacterium]|jgi:hypothetical protein|nr:hypothetical protein [bacterium]
MSKRQIRIKRNQILKKKDEIIDQYMSVVITDKRSYFLKAIKIDHINFEGIDMRRNKHSFSFMDIDEIILEQSV